MTSIIVGRRARWRKDVILANSAKSTQGDKVSFVRCSLPHSSVSINPTISMVYLDGRIGDDVEIYAELEIHCAVEADNVVGSFGLLD